MAAANLKWCDFRDMCVARNLSMQWKEVKKVYWLIAFDGPFQFECVLRIDDPANNDQIEFETNYKNAVTTNKKIEAPKDSDGSPLQRVKITTTGWHYQLHGVEFETSKLNSIYSKKVDGTDYGFSSIKFYELVNGVETEITGANLNQTYLDSNCIKTIMDWEPTHDLEIIGGMLKQKEIPGSDVRLWVIGVPDVPEVAGGSKPFAVNINLAFIGIEEGVKVDGRAPKYLTYNATYHTSKLRIMLRHPVGFKHKMNMIFELFKA